MDCRVKPGNDNSGRRRRTTRLCDLLCDCPTGKSLKPVQPSHKKYSASHSPQITPTTPAIPRPQEGRIAIVTDVGCGERWPRHAGRATRLRRVSLLMSEGRAPTNGANFPLSPEFDGQVPGPANPLGEDGSRTAKPCGPGARCWRQAGGGFEKSNRVCQSLQSAGDGGKRNSSPGRARYKP